MKKIGLICLSLVIALGATGIGYAAVGGLWTQDLFLTGTVQTSTLSWEYVAASAWQAETGMDQTCDAGLANIRPTNPAKDVASTTLTLKDLDADGLLDTLTISVANAYPCYYNQVGALLHNGGNLPLTINGATLAYNGAVPAPLSFGSLYTSPDGAFELLLAAPAPSYDIGTGVSVSEVIQFHALPALIENRTYTIDIKINAVLSSTP